MKYSKFGKPTTMTLRFSSVCQMGKKNPRWKHKSGDKYRNKNPQKLRRLNLKGRVFLNSTAVKILHRAGIAEENNGAEKRPRRRRGHTSACRET